MFIYQRNALAVIAPTVSLSSQLTLHSVTTPSPIPARAPIPTPATNHPRPHSHPRFSTHIWLEIYCSIDYLYFTLIAKHFSNLCYYHILYIFF